jgi:hypothetical protein
VLPIPPETPRTTGTYIYRYGNGEHLEWLKSLMLRHELYVPEASSLNDLRDARPRVHRPTREKWLSFMNGLRPKGLTPLPRKEHASIIEDVANSLGIDNMLDIATESYYRMTTRYRIYSMSKRWDNLSMWHWYASKHRGYCLEFLNLPSFGHVRDVVYDSSYVLDMTDISHATPNWFFYKSPDWSNEEEVRLVLPKKIGGPVLPFNPRALNRVILGKDMPALDIARVREWGVARDPRVPVVTTRWDAVRLQLVIDSDPETPPRKSDTF